jgi:uncharacterized protein (TIGR02646 family)
MTAFAYSVQEYLSIVRALSIGKSPRPTPTKIWSSSHVKQVKARLKAHKRLEQGERCCYCQRSTLGEFKMVLDIEHILPKSTFSHCIFDLSNLAVSCKKCNMKIKGERLDFLNGEVPELLKMDKSQLFKKELYKFAHPNLLSVYEHLSIYKSLDGPVTILHYRILTEIGQYTYDFFRLEEFVTESMDRVQGLPPPSDDSLHEQIKALEREVYD